MDNLENISNSIRDELNAKNAARDLALARSRELIRFCATAIKAIHRELGAGRGGAPDGA